jgi:hypothetical protein
LFRETFTEGLERAVESRREKNGGEGRGSGPTAAARVRNEGEDFSASFLELRDAVGRSCRRQAKWQAKVIAAIEVTLEFAAAEPGKARALTVDARRSAFGDLNPEQVVLHYFAGRLAEVAPAEKRVPISTDEGIVEAIAALIRGHLLGETESALPAAAPDLVYLALMPYLSLAETRRWADAAAADA